MNASSECWSPAWPSASAYPASMPKRPTTPAQNHICYRRDRNNPVRKSSRPADSADTGMGMMGSMQDGDGGKAVWEWAAEE